MAHKTLIGGTAYEIAGGKTLVNGTVYSINGGKTLVDGTVREISFTKQYTVSCTKNASDFIATRNRPIYSNTDPNNPSNMATYGIDIADSGGNTTVRTIVGYKYTYSAYSNDENNDGLYDGYHYDADRVGPYEYEADDGKTYTDAGMYLMPWTGSNSFTCEINESDTLTVHAHAMNFGRGSDVSSLGDWLDKSEIYLNGVLVASQEGHGNKFDSYVSYTLPRITGNITIYNQFWGDERGYDNTNAGGSYYVPTYTRVFITMEG